MEDSKQEKSAQQYIAEISGELRNYGFEAP